MKRFQIVLASAALLLVTVVTVFAASDAEATIIRLLDGIYQKLAAPAPTPGGATEAKQDTGNASLGSIVGSLGTVAANTAMPTLIRFRSTALTATAAAVKASAGNVHGWNIINPNAVPVYVKLYDMAAGSVTVGTSAVIMTIAVPANGAMFVRSETMPQQSFTAAITVAAVTGRDDNSTAAPTIAVHASIQYK